MNTRFGTKCIERAKAVSAIVIGFVIAIESFGCVPPVVHAEDESGSTFPTRTFYRETPNLREDVSRSTEFLLQGVMSNFPSFSMNTENTDEVQSSTSTEIPPVELTPQQNEEADTSVTVPEEHLESKEIQVLKSDEVGRNSEISTENLIQNPSLEESEGSGRPTNWTTYSSGKNTPTFSYPVKGSEGKSAARVSLRSYKNGQASWVFDPVAVVEGATYSFTHSYRSNKNTSLIARYTKTDGSVFDVILETLEVSKVWKVDTISIMVPQDVKAVSFFQTLNSNGWLEVDDYRLSGKDRTTEDTEAPRANITDPHSGDTLSGVVTVTSTVTDNADIARVDLLVNGVVKASSQSAPYTFSVDTTVYDNGPLTFKVVAYDSSGNSGTSEAVIVTIKNVSDTTNQNLIQNPSFEAVATNGDPKGWYRGGWGTNTASYEYPVTGIDGDRAVSVSLQSYTDGDAKWYFENVPVTPYDTYVYTEKYKSDVETELIAQYTLDSGEMSYVSLERLPASDVWKDARVPMTVPLHAVSLTIFHVIQSVGFLTLDATSLQKNDSTEPPLNAFAEGMVSFSFDDGWKSQYDEALPILKSANMKGTFYIISDEMTNASLHDAGQNLVQNSSLETKGVNGNPIGWHQGMWGTNKVTFTYPVSGKGGGSAAKVAIGAYTSGDAKWYFDEVPVSGNSEYVFSDTYSSNIASEVVAQYTLSNGKVSYVTLGTPTSSKGAWVTFETTFKTPKNVASVTIFHVIKKVGELSLDTVSLQKKGEVRDYMNTSEVLALQNAGQEIGSHTLSHPSLPSLPPADARREITQSKHDLEAAGVDTIRSFAYPYGDYNESVLQSVKEAGYVSARDTEEGFNYTDTPHYELKMQTMDRDTTLEEVKAWVTEAKRSHTWLIFMFHQIDGVPANIYGVTPAFLSEVVQYVKDAQVKVVTVSQGAEYLEK